VASNISSLQHCPAGAQILLFRLRFSASSEPAFLGFSSLVFGWGILEERITAWGAGWNRLRFMLLSCNFWKLLMFHTLAAFGAEVVRKIDFCRQGNPAWPSPSISHAKLQLLHLSRLPIETMTRSNCQFGRSLNTQENGAGTST